MAPAASPLTSMEKKPPPLSLMELHQLRWLLGGVLALVSIWSVWYLEIDAWMLLLVTTAAALVTLVRPTLPARWPRWAHKFAFPVVLSALVFDLYTFGEVLPALVRLAILLLFYRVSTYRKRRDDLQLILLGLFLVVATGVLTVSIGFAIQIVAFSALALAMLLTRTLVDALEAGRKDLPEETQGIPTWANVEWATLFRRVAQVSDWRVWGLGVFLFAGLVGLSALLFLAIPRFQVESSLFLDRWMNKRSVSGFTDTLRFGEVSDIQKDDSVALHIDVSDPANMPSELYWRMIVLDEYRDRAFHLSTALQAAAMSPEFVTADLPGFGDGPKDDREWKIYVEPGVSRYLPVLGSFRHLAFTETQSLRVSRELRLITLAREPSTLKAYRIRGMDTTGALADTTDWLSRRDNENARIQAQKIADTLVRALPFALDEKAQWIRAAQEILDGRELSPTEFARAATIWLHQRHTYSLKSQLPAGEGDPLTRWAMSREPGHCELFAGSFAMLARAAGFPTRVVGGFVGGTWVGDYLAVKNSDAHAWCEIRDEDDHRWLRVDPTAPPNPESALAAEQEQRVSARMNAELTWSMRMDRLRMMWYRRIVNFDRRDQMNIAKTLKEGTEASGKRVRAWAEDFVKRMHDWIASPWDYRRIGRIAAAVAGAVVLIWAWRAGGRVWWWRWRASRRRGVDPIRREAGRWILKFRSLPLAHSADVDRQKIEAALERLRYGARETWPAAEIVFRDARRVFRKARRNQSVAG